MWNEPNPTEWESLVHLLQTRARRDGDSIAWTFLGDGERETERLSMAELDARARAVAARLLTVAEPGERALLLHPPGAGFITALLGCFYAGVVAVPAYPPDPRRLELTLGRLRGIALDCGARFACTSAEILPMVEALAPMAPELAALRWLSTDDAPPSAAPLPAISAKDLAFLQYTSGSTAAPKGVMIGHDNLLANLALIHAGVGQGPGSAAVLWLPPYHDMGLMNNLYGLAAGFPVVAMGPYHFLQRPRRWLEAMTRYGATYSGGPNFAFELLLRKVQDLDGLDLSRWAVAFNGAEPVRADTLARFTERFAACGFRPEAHYPCYGLAEVTVAATGSTRGEPVQTLDTAAGLCVSSGRAQAGHEVRVVDPERRQARPDGEPGEIWVRGPSVARGYWGKEALSGQVFRAHLASGEGPFLRTGDLGVLAGGELYVQGRLKDLLIVRGQNHHPPDIERTVERCDPGVQPGGVAAVGVEAGGEEALVLLVELRPGAERPGLEERLRGAVVRGHGLAPADIAFFPPGALPKTTSGKLQRFAARALYLESAR